MPRPTFKPKFKPRDIVYCSTIEAIASPIEEPELLSLREEPPLQIDVVMWIIDGKPVNGSILHCHGACKFLPGESPQLGPYYYLCKNTATNVHHLIFEQALSTTKVHLKHP